MRLLPLSFALALLAACLPEDKLKVPLNMEPVQQNDGWQISTPEAEGFDAAKLQKAYKLVFSEDEYHTAYSLLVIRNGKLVAEGYTYDLEDIDRLNNIKSATKSVTSLLTGIALEEGYLRAVTQSISELIPAYVAPGSAKADITLAHLLTMTSGLRWDNDEETAELMIDRPGDSLAFAVDQPLDFAPGAKFHYSDGQPHILGAILQEVTGKSLEQYADEKLFVPLGITDYLWEQHRDGVNYGAYGIYLRPRDLAKIGQLALNGGAWKGQQLVSPGWITEATQVHANQNEGPYGYYWWIRPDFGGFMAAGHGGQFAYVIPAKNLLIVMTANPYTDGIGVSFEDFEILVYRILEAIVE